MEINITSYGKTHSYKYKYDDHDIPDMLKIFKGLLQSMGYIFDLEEHIVVMKED